MRVLLRRGGDRRRLRPYDALVGPGRLGFPGAAASCRAARDALDGSVPALNGSKARPGGASTFTFVRRTGPHHAVVCQRADAPVMATCARRGARRTLSEVCRSRRSRWVRDVRHDSRDWCGCRSRRNFRYSIVAPGRGRRVLGYSLRVVPVSEKGSLADDRPVEVGETGRGPASDGPRPQWRPPVVS
jgi:hypothetical protein